MKACSRSMSSRAKSRRGFTLIELIVVLMILVGLAGMIVPAVADMVARTHTATAARNISEVANAVARYEVQYLSYPTRLDSLSDNATLAAAGTWDQAPEGVTATVTLTADTADALANAGVNSLAVHTDGQDSATFTQSATFVTPADTNVVYGLTVAQQQSFGLEATGVAGKYVVFGVGGQNTAIGKTMTTAPVHFPESAAENLNTSYGRFLAVFQITDGTDALERAKLVAVYAPEGASQGDELAEYFEIVSDR